MTPQLGTPDKELLMRFGTYVDMWGKYNSFPDQTVIDLHELQALINGCRLTERYKEALEEIAEGDFRMCCWSHQQANAVLAAPTNEEKPR